MPPLPLFAWLLIVGAGSAGILASLFALACRMDRAIEEHDLQVRTIRLRGEYTRWMDAVRRGETEGYQRPAMLDSSNRMMKRAA